MPFSYISFFSNILRYHRKRLWMSWNVQQGSFQSFAVIETLRDWFCTNVTLCMHIHLRDKSSNGDCKELQAICTSFWWTVCYYPSPAFLLLSCWSYITRTSIQGGFASLSDLCYRFLSSLWSASQTLLVLFCMLIWFSLLCRNFHIYELKIYVTFYIMVPWFFYFQLWKAFSMDLNKFSIFNISVSRKRKCTLGERMCSHCGKEKAVGMKCKYKEAGKQAWGCGEDFRKPQKLTQVPFTSQVETYRFLSWRAELTRIRLQMMKEPKRPTVPRVLLLLPHCPPRHGAVRTTRAGPCPCHLMASWPWTSSRNDVHAPGLGTKKRVKQTAA